MFNHCPVLVGDTDISELYDKWLEYKNKTPTHGAILMNPEMTNVGNWRVWGGDGDGEEEGWMRKVEGREGERMEKDVMK